jgi:hypothetical protein
MAQKRNAPVAEGDPLRLVQPEEWIILGNYNFRGVIYGKNEPMAEGMTERDIQGYVRQGTIAKRTADGTPAPRPIPKPETPGHYLRQNDTQVLHAIREHRPSHDDIVMIAAEARRMARPTLLVEALLLAAELTLPERQEPAHEGKRSASAQP